MSDVGEAIETTRRAIGVTQGDLAQGVGVTQAALSRYENGEREPSEDVLKRIAEVLGVTTDFLCTAPHAESPIAVESHMRRRATAKVADWRRAEARLNVMRRQVDRVFSKVEMTPTLYLPTVDPTEMRPEEAAQLVRQQWRMPIGPVRKLSRWMDAAGIAVVEDDLQTPRIDGLSQRVGLFPVVLINQDVPTDRKRLTMAHELGHIVLHSEYATANMESEANLFAGEFLMPATAIRPHLRSLSTSKLKSLKAEWGVSMQALVERAHQLGVMNSTDRTAFYKKMSRLGWRTQEPGSDLLPQEEPQLLSMVQNQLENGGLTQHSLEKLSGVRANRIDSVFRERHPRLRTV